MESKPFTARVLSSIDLDPLPHHISSEIVVVPENAGGHGPYITFQDLFQFILEREEIECSESGADFDYQIIVAISPVVPSGTGSEKINGGDVMFPSHRSDYLGQLLNGIFLAEQIAEHVDVNGTELEKCYEKQPGIGRTSKYQSLSISSRERAMMFVVTELTVLTSTADAVFRSKGMKLNGVQMTVNNLMQELQGTTVRLDRS